MDKQKAAQLITRYLDGTCTKEERLMVEAWYNEAMQAQESWPLDEGLEAIGQAIYEQLPTTATTVTRPPWPRIAAAASVLFFLSVGAYYLFHQPSQPQLAQNNPEQIAPVNKGVTLTLGGGRQIQLRQKHQGRIASIGNTQINQSDSLLSYQGTGTPHTEPATHTLTNNSGQKFSLTLADGTQASLDIASSITYPVSFTGKERDVTVTGQVFFKVKHDAAQPFVVTAGTEKIEDIGTEFNINAYEPTVSTTLVSGAVKVSAHRSSVRLKPGEQAEDLKVSPANLEEATAWLQGKIVFHHETLESLLNKVSRIYGVHIIWMDDMRRQEFGGSVSRSKKLSTVLNYFRKAGNVDFQVEGNSVKVFKKKK